MLSLDGFDVEASCEDLNLREWSPRYRWPVEKLDAGEVLRETLPESAFSFSPVTGDPCSLHLKQSIVQMFLDLSEISRQFRFGFFKVVKQRQPWSKQLRLPLSPPRQTSVAMFRTQRCPFGL